jgi:chorismate dehydratase
MLDRPQSADRPLRIGAVSYLNTAPLVRGLPGFLPEAELSLDHPSRLADQLAEGRIDVALAPVVELARHPEWSIVSTACIACRGPVLSVKLLFRVPPGEVRSLALDEGSRTSAVLAQVLLAKTWTRGAPSQAGGEAGYRGRRSDHLRLEVLPVKASPLESTADAVLVIGDRAIAEAPAEFCETWDLGERWRAETGLPFVFAVWAARPGVEMTEVEAGLDASRDLGLQELDAIAEERSAAMGLPRALVLRYFREHLHFHLGPNERRGLELYFREAAALGLIPSGSELRFDDCAAER